MITESVNSILARQELNQQAAAGAASNVVDKDGFLKLLIAQMQHQDPLSPLDNTEFLSQMAQFSTLEQLQNINGNLTSSLEWDLLFNQTINNTMATSLIGREVEALGNDVIVGTSGDVVVRYDLGSWAKEVSLQITNGAGDVVFTTQQSGMSAGMHDWTWDGNDQTGTRVAPGNYTVHIDAFDAQGNPVTAESARVGIVTGVEYDGGGAYLLVDGQRLSLSDIRRISFSGTS